MNTFFKNAYAHTFMWVSTCVSALTIHIGVAHAQSGPGTFSVFTVPKYCNEHECGWKELTLLGGELLKFAIFIAVIGATVAFVFAGFKLMTNQGNSGEISKAKDMMSSATKGIIVTMIAWLMVNFILNQLGVGSDFRLPGM